jgi:hypothetical protein
MEDDGATANEPVDKPDELLALHEVTAELFGTLREWFGVPESVRLDLTEVDSAVTELGDPMLIAAMAMRKLQALHLIATPGVRTTTDVVVAIVQDLQRALIQAPAMRLKLAASATDWDAELASLDHPAGSARSAPTTADEADPEADRFRGLHALVNLAMEATIEASEGRIRTLL